MFCILQMKSKDKRASTFPVCTAKFVINAIAARIVINPGRNRRLQVQSIKKCGARTAELMQLESFGVEESCPVS